MELLSPQLNHRNRSNGESFEGTIFDLRAYISASDRFNSFEEATKAIPNPTYFLGVSKNVLNLIRGCDWDALLNYRHSQPVNRMNVNLATNGVLNMQMKSDEMTEKSARNLFEINKGYKKRVSAILKYVLDTE